MSYPKRPTHFAHKFCRKLTKVAAANVIGADVCWMLTVIAHQEDSKRYTGPVTYWNHQLMDVTGLKSTDRLVRVRTAAVRAGWLHYEKGGKGKIGTYWVLIPQWALAVADGTSDESDDEDLSSQNATVNPTKTYEKPTRNRTIPDCKPPTFNPSPFPNPKDPGRRSGFSEVNWWKGFEDSDLKNDSKIDVLFGAVVAAGYAHDTPEDRQRFTALVIYIRRQDANKPFGLFTRIVEGRANSKFAKRADWRSRATDADHDASRRLLRNLDADEELEAAS